VLAEANLIESRREGQFVYNRTLPETIREYGQALSKIAQRKKAAS
jgi:DNA-binding transcriptional ArsR family regulator